MCTSKPAISSYILKFQILLLSLTMQAEWSWIAGGPGLDLAFRGYSLGIFISQMHNTLDLQLYQSNSFQSLWVSVILGSHAGDHVGSPNSCRCLMQPTVWPGHRSLFRGGSRGGRGEQWPGGSGGGGGTTIWPAHVTHRVVKKGIWYFQGIWSEDLAGGEVIVVSHFAWSRLLVCYVERAPRGFGVGHPKPGPGSLWG